MHKDLTPEDIDEILQELESALDVKPTGNGANVFEIRDGKQRVSEDSSVLRFECPTDLWEEFTEYCKRNELDPAQQIREAVIGYYKNLWQTYKIRKKLFDKSDLV